MKKQSEANAEIAARHLKELEKCISSRSNIESNWRDTSEMFWPGHKTLFGARGHATKGEKRNGKIYDSTPVQALSRFAAILDSLLTPRNATWHRLKPSNPDLLKDRETKLWFDEANKLLFKYRYAPKANFASQNQDVYQHLGGYGSACMFTDKLRGRGEKGLRYKSCFIGEIFFKENHQGIVDTVLRYYPMTARQAEQKWGADKLPEAIVKKLEKDPECEFQFLHVVKPREDVDPDRVDFKGMPFASYYISEEGKHLVDEGGYTSFPYSTPRYRQAPNEVFGRSPAMDAYPAARTLNEEKKTQLKVGQRIVDPVLLAFDDGVMDDFSLRSGAVNYGGLDSQGRELVKTLKTGNYQVGKDLMELEKNDINDIFLVSLFQILAENPQMTATEVVERTKEKGMLLAPTVGRQQSEYLGPMIERELDVLSEQNLLPAMPPAMIEAQGEYEIEYESPLSRAQKAEETSGLMRSVEFTLQVVNVTQNPAPLDHYDWDVIIPEVADQQGVPAKWRRSIDEVQQIRQGRAEQQQAQQAVEAAPGVAALANSATKAESAQ